jgi:hypothetical protein
MKIVDLIKRDMVVPALQATDKRGILEELAAANADAVAPPAPKAEPLVPHMTPSELALLQSVGAQSTSVVEFGCGGSTAEWLRQGVERVVSVHGYGRRGYSNVVLIGGRNRRLAARAADTLRAAVPSHRFVDDLHAIPPTLRGVHIDNPVNRTRGGGIQLELPPTLRDGEGALSDRDALISALASLAEEVWEPGRVRGVAIEVPFRFLIRYVLEE